MNSVFIKTALVLFLIMGVFSTTVQACDACGCAGGGNYLGLLPQFNKRFVGLRYRTNIFESYANTLSLSKNVKDDSYSSMELWARFYPIKKVQVLVFLPYGFNTKYEDGVQQQNSSIGDASALASYQIFTNMDSLYAKYKHALLGGIGVKLPTGKFMQRNSDKILFAPGFQVGTGAYALLANVIYTAKISSVGFNLNLNYALNGKSENDYRFGNVFSGNLSAFYALNFEKITALPNVGLVLENRQADIQYGNSQVNTAGNSRYLSLGSEFYAGKFAFGGNYQLPLNASVTGDFPTSKTRFFASFSVLF